MSPGQSMDEYQKNMDAVYRILTKKPLLVVETLAKEVRKKSQAMTIGGLAQSH